MSKVKKAIIPVGGFGTRFLPATKTTAKEMFPVGRKPVVLHVVEEVVKAGIKDIIFVVAQHKHPIEDFFSRNEMMEKYFSQLGKKDRVKEIREIAKMANYTFVYTEPPKGNGGALSAAEHLINDEPFLVVWGDEFFWTPKKSRVQRLLDVYEKYEVPVVSCVKIPDKEKRKLYGIADLRPYNGERKIKQIVKIVEKPRPDSAPSPYAAHSAYILSPLVFESLKRVRTGRAGEMWIADLINDMKTKTGLLGCMIDDGVYLDCGNPRDYLFSQIEYGLIEGEYKKELKQHLRKLLKKY